MSLSNAELGFAARQNKEYSQAITHFRNAIAEMEFLEPLTILFLFAIGEASFLNNDFDLSVRGYNDGVNLFMKHRAMFLKQYPNESIIIEKSLAQVFRIRGNAKRELQDFTGSIEDYSTSLEKDSNLTDSLYSRGVSYLDLREFRKAANDFTEVIKRNSNDHQAWKHLGDAQYSLGNFEEAIRAYSEGLSTTYPDYNKFELLKNRAAAKSQLNEFKGAIDDLYLALDIKPSDIQTKEDIKLLMVQLGLKLSDSET